MEGLEGKVAIVTGAAMGIGARIAELLLQAGASVVAGDIAYEALDERFGGVRSVRIRHADVRRRSECEDLAAAAIDLHGRVDILVNNAGITRRALLEDTTDELWDNVLQTNLASAFYMARSVVPTMRARGGGAIVNVASINAIRGNLELTAYGASKGGMAGMTRVMAMELAPDNIRVNALCPGTVDTPMNDEYLAAVEDPEATTEMLVAKHPLGRIATADDVAWAALFLTSDMASFITGVSLPIDGGRHLGR
ncbi:MAG: SDR family NAD(P)-dependent oxidoreductase [bacterium]|nr:SDR family NAD(P)-dependent oxidoreductase [bacterium]MDE0287810.1 SDR family NAD(P)-dependent oxidoreductase [bacterium]MDE0438301.1 SDR family NAD(P)-dependent oxidoreductase [bacterium]